MSVTVIGQDTFSPEQCASAQAIVERELERNPTFAERWAIACSRARRESPDIPANASPTDTSWSGDRVGVPCEAAATCGGFTVGEEEA